MNNKNYLLALNRIYKIGPRTVSKMLKKWPNLADLFAASTNELNVIGLPEPIQNSIKSFNFEVIESDLAWEEKSNLHHIVTIEDPRYPLLLKEIYDPPSVLYLIGNISILNNIGLSIVGTRKPSPMGRETAYRFAKTLARENIAIISGLALGIDFEAHRGAIDGGGITIAVMATGIDRIYPLRHKSLAEIIKKNGLLISEFPLKTPPQAGHFPRRNRIISGLSLATLVIEAAIKSGSLITARFALEQNREVLAVPGSIDNPQTRGCHQLLQQGAKLVTSITDIINELPHLERTIREDNVLPLANMDQNLVKFIGFEITSIDKIMQRSGLSLEIVLSEVLSLELQGLIKKEASGYVRCKV